MRLKSDHTAERPLATAPSVLVALVGSGIQASRTPRLHEQEGFEHGLRYIYKLVDLEALRLDSRALPDILSAAQRFGFAGLNVTHPCKQSVIPLLDDLSPDASALGAVNTVVFRDGRRVGHNTDWLGFAESFTRELNDAARNCIVLLGAGGAGAAVAHALLTLGTRKLCVIDVDRAKAEDLARALRERFGSDRAVSDVSIEVALASADGLVNASPVGMAKYPGVPAPRHLLRCDVWVAEIIYFPLETELLQSARALGCRTMSGEGMAVFQAAAAFKLFTGREPDAARMMRHFKAM